MLPLVAALVRLQLLWADVILWLPVLALCTPLGVQLFVSVTVVSGVSPQAVSCRAYRERFRLRTASVCYRELLLFARGVVTVNLTR